METSSGLRERVFVYGTLRVNAEQGGRMKGAHLLGSGVVGGRLYQVDWYPGLVLANDGEVVGEVYEVDEVMLAALDEYEGGEYRRVKVQVKRQTELFPNRGGFVGTAASYLPVILQ